MSKEPIELVKEKIKDCEAEESRLGSRISRLHNETEEAERRLFHVRNTRLSLESALKILEEAKEKEAEIGPAVPEKLEEEHEPTLKEAMEKVAERKALKIPDEAILEPGEKEEELTPEEKTKAALEDADRLIKREKKRQEQAKKGWRLCSKCNSNRISPANKTGICTPCQQSSEGKRPYKRRKT